MTKYLLSIIFLCVIATLAKAQNASGGEPSSPETRVYDEEHPLVYEDAWDLWPYAFLNDNGEPVGFNIDLLKLICKELNIPYRIKLKPTQDALDDLKAGRADLMCAMDAHFHNDYAQYGKSVIQMFTHSVVKHKDAPQRVRTVDDLASQRVIVHTGSFSHHYMSDRGWGKNAIPYNDMQDAVHYAHSHHDSQIVWNTLSLKWLLRKFNYTDLELTPINLPHGEYKFMSNNSLLLEQLDSVYAKLNSAGQLQPIQNKWFYPERRETGIPSWVWHIVNALVVVIIAFLICYFVYRLYERKMTRNVMRFNNRLSLILNTSKVHIWLFDISARVLTSINSDGKRVTLPLSPNFEHYYMVPEDFERLCVLLGEMGARKKERETLELQAVRRNSRARHIFSVDFSVMRRDGNGRPTVIIGASTDITESRQRQQQQNDTMLRYQHIFNSALVDTVSYNEHGIIDDMNEKSVRGIGGNLQRIIDAHVSVQEVLGEPDLKLEDLDYTYLTQIYKSPDDDRTLNQVLGRDELYYELQLEPIRDDEGHLLGIYGTGRDVTELAKSYSRIQKNIVALQKATNELQDYMRNIDYVLKNGGVRMVNYSPDTHTLTVYSELEHVQQRLTQTRLLSLVAEESKKTAQRLMNNMDYYSRHPARAVVKTTLKRRGKQLSLLFSFVPLTDADGNITEYFGMCRDISDIKATEELLALETKKAQEVETVKNAFLHNMCYEIRTPLNSVVGFAELIENEPGSENEQFFIEEIKSNTRKLLNLVNNILFLSRLDAGMIEFKPEPVDFAAIFEGRCKSAWMHCQQPGVEFIVDSPYDHLTVDIDLTNLGVVIDQIVTNAAQNTTSGYIRARFDYNGEDLTVTIQDTGCGIAADQLDRIFERFVTTGSDSSGLGLAICQEVVKLMGGRIHLKSEVGKGTIVWIIIPCPANGN